MTNYQVLALGKIGRIGGVAMSSHQLTESEKIILKQMARESGLNGNHIKWLGGLQSFWRALTDNQMGIIPPVVQEQTRQDGLKTEYKKRW